MNLTKQLAAKVRLFGRTLLAPSKQGELMVHSQRPLFMIQWFLQDLNPNTTATLTHTQWSLGHSAHAVRPNNRPP